MLCEWTFGYRKLNYFRQRNSITGYTPYGARSLNELAINDEFSGASDSGVSFGAYVLLMPINGTNLMDLDSLREAIEVLFYFFVEKIIGLLRWTILFAATLRCLIM